MKDRVSPNMELLKVQYNCTFLRRSGLIFETNNFRLFSTTFYRHSAVNNGSWLVINSNILVSINLFLCQCQLNIGFDFEICT